MIDSFGILPSARENSVNVFVPYIAWTIEIRVMQRMCAYEQREVLHSCAGKV